ncbi:MAG: dimethylargininase [Microbacteriaceae bacterium]|jgi:dimethylargininase|nr:dimethylargininase [Microbacteriaceae bacterium]MDQ1554698.1 dimethylargininase [Microbacteriaceae bacterium]
MTTSAGQPSLSGRASYGRTISGRIIAAAVSALVVAVTAYVATILAFFVAGGAVATNFGQLNSFFIWSAVFTFLFVGLLAMTGSLGRWYGAVATGIIAGALASLVGSSLSVVATGTPFGGAVASFAVGTLVGPNLIFVAAVVVATVTAGRAVWFAFAKRTAPVGGRRVLLVRPPADTLSDGELTHLERTPVDLDLANAQWNAYVTAFADNGWQIEELPLANDLSDSVFIEDDVVLFGGTAVLASPGAESRRGEIESVERAVRSLRLKVARIELPGTLDGGDVLKVGKTVYVGRGGRTNAEGIRQLRGIVAPLGYAVVGVPVTMALHLKSSVTALPDGTVIGFPAIVDEPALFDRFLAVPEIGGLGVVALSHDTVLMAASAPQSAALIADLGYRVITVDISEFEKLEGCITCLSVRVR